MKLDHDLSFFKNHVSKIYNYLKLNELEDSETIENTSENDGSE